MEDIFSKHQLESAIVKTAYEFRTCVFIKKDNGKFERDPLTAEAQFSTVYTILVDDFDKDGLNDILLAGNLFGLKPESGRYDANYGVYYKGLPKNKLAYKSPSYTGFFYRGEARDLISIININQRQMLILARNNDSLMIFENNLNVN